MIKPIVCCFMLSAFAAAVTLSLGAENPTAKKIDANILKSMRGGTANVNAANAPKGGDIADISKKKPMRAFIFATRNDKNLDWWTHVPPNKSVMPTVATVWRGDTVCFNSLVSNFTSVPDEDFDLKIKISMDKNGKIETLGERPFKGNLKKPSLFAMLPTEILATFEAHDPFGKYSLFLEVENLKTGEKTEANYTVELVEWKTPNSFNAKQINEKILGFNSSFYPPDLYSILVSDDFTFRQKGLWYGLNPSLYSFAKNAFENNRFLLPILRANFKNFSEQVKENVILLFAFLGENPIEMDFLSPDQVVKQTKFRKFAKSIPVESPYKVLKNPSVLDLLWGEFFAKGTYASARRILDSLLYQKEREFAEKKLKSKSLDKSNSEEMEKFFKGLTCLAGEWSISRNVNNALFCSYFKWAIENDTTPELRAAVKDFFKRTSAFGKKSVVKSESDASSKK